MNKNKNDWSADQMIKDIMYLSNLIPTKNYNLTLKNRISHCLNKHFFSGEFLTFFTANPQKRKEYISACIARDIASGKKVIILQDYNNIDEHACDVLDPVWEIYTNVYGMTEGIEIQWMRDDNSIILSIPEIQVFFCKQYCNRLAKSLKDNDVSVYLFNTSCLTDAIALKRDFNELGRRDVITTLVLSKTDEEGNDITDKYMKPFYDKYKEHVKFFCKLTELLSKMWKNNPEEFNENDDIQKFLKYNPYVEYDIITDSYIFNKYNFLIYYTSI